MKINEMFARSIACALAASGSLIVSESALAQGADNCSGATEVTAGVAQAFSTTTATTSGEPVDETQCEGTDLAWGTANRDVWFKFTAPSEGLVDFSTCSAGSFDTSMVIYTGADCTNLVQVACNGDGTGETGCQLYYSRVAGIAASAGDVFFIRIGGFTGASGTSASGNGNLRVTFTGPVCSTATGDCREAHGGLGCSVSTCCETVCAANPFCCDTAWDSDCVALVPDLCGLFVYSCPGTGTPANDCATNPQVVTQSGSLPWSNVGATEDGPDHSGAVCLSGGDTFPHDIWWRVTAPASGLMTVSTCGTVPFDNKMAVYDMGTDPSSFDFNNLPTVLVGCNDDGPDPCLLSDSYDTYASEVTVGVEAGRTYLVRMGSFEDDETPAETGSGTIQFTLPTACQIDATTSLELEPCGEDTNSACIAAGFSELISLGTSRKGTMWADGGFRDVDFYRFTVGSDSEVTVTAKSASFARVVLFNGDISATGCGGLVQLGTSFGTCSNSLTRCLDPGEYYVFVGAVTPSGAVRGSGLPCGSGTLNEYSLTVTGSPANCPEPPSVIDATCSAPGPDVRALSASTTDLGWFAPGWCATACANLAGGTADVAYAIKITGDNLLSEISCVNFGYYFRRSFVNSSGTCTYGTETSGPRLPAKLEFYRDLDGGDPRNFIQAADDGNDLELIESFDILVPSGFGIGNFEPSQPVCLEGETDVVMVYRTPNLFNGPNLGVPPNAGYRADVRVGAVPTGLTTTTYTLAPLCGDVEFQLFAVPAYDWTVNINGSASASCSGSDCPADLDNPPDGVVGGTDLAALLAAWGTNSPDVELDTPPNNVISGTDLAVLLAAWGPCAP